MKSDDNRTVSRLTLQATILIVFPAICQKDVGIGEQIEARKHHDEIVKPMLVWNQLGRESIEFHGVLIIR